jgi:predicted ATPase
LTQAGSAQLLLERITAGVAGFALDETSARHVAAICQRLDGIPLALELAARVPGLGIAEVAGRLGPAPALASPWANRGPAVWAARRSGRSLRL